MIIILRVSDYLNVSMSIQPCNWNICSRCLDAKSGVVVWWRRNLDWFHVSRIQTLVAGTAS